MRVDLHLADGLTEKDVAADAARGHLREGVLFLPFHYGYWDPVAKQPRFKTAAAAISRLIPDSPEAKPGTRHHDE